jgi:hypothetical protein
VTLREAIAMMILAECQPAKIGLKAIAGELPALTGSALLKLAADTAPWSFAGSQADHLRYTLWFNEQEFLGTRHILGMLDLRPKDLSRYLATAPRRTLRFNDIQVLADTEHTSIVIFIDSWGFASRLRQSIQSELFTVTRRSAGEE